MKCQVLTVGNLRDRFKYKQLELNPPYQRRPVWKTKQRKLTSTRAWQRPTP